MDVLIEYAEKYTSKDVADVGDYVTVSNGFE